MSFHFLSWLRLPSRQVVPHVPSNSERPLAFRAASLPEIGNNYPWRFRA